jgi:hypothetical protein
MAKKARNAVCHANEHFVNSGKRMGMDFDHFMARIDRATLPVSPIALLFVHKTLLEQDLSMYLLHKFPNIKI